VKQNLVRLDLMGIEFCNFLYFLQFYFLKKSLGTEALLTTSPDCHENTMIIVVAYV
jgi:hypothetical protein